MPGEAERQLLAALLPRDGAFPAQDGGEVKSMNNFDVGRAIVDEALRARGAGPCTQQQALAILDQVCDRWRNNTVEFESQHPEKVHEVHPDYDQDTYPIAPFGLLLKEAFWPDIEHDDWQSLQETWGLSEDDMTDAEHRLQHAWYERVEFAFNQRYGLYGYDPGGPMPYIGPIRVREPHDLPESPRE